MERDIDREPSPEERIEKLTSLLDLVRAREPRSQVEIYQRSSTRRRAVLGGDERPDSTIAGEEEGTAVRLVGPDDACRFGAASGSGERAVDRALAAARDSFPRSRARGDLWANGEGEPLRDDADEGTDAPAEDALDAWLHGAWRRLTESGELPASLWVETARTVETWAADGGLRASRTRSRAWAMVMLRGAGDAHGGVRARAAAARSLEDLDLRGLELGPTHSRKSVGSCWILPPHVAAELVVPLVEALHGPGCDIGVTVGPAWNLADDPLGGRTLSGGSFDDAGFRAARLRLAGGGRVLAALGDRGHFRRGSFRDPPVPTFSSLELEGGSELTAADGVPLVGLRVHRLREARWILEIEEARCSEPFLVPVTPTAVARGLVAAIGPARTTARGVITPTLVLQL